MKRFTMDGWITSSEIKRRTTQSGKVVLSFSLNSPTRRKNPQSGEWENNPQFFDCKLWLNSDNDWRGRYVQNRKHIFIAGKPTHETWQDQNGGNHSKVVFLIDELLPIEERNNNQQSAPAQSYTQAQQSAQSYTQAPAPAYSEPVMYDEDIPF